MVYFVRVEDCWEEVPYWLIKGMIIVDIIIPLRRVVVSNKYDHSNIR